jgi:hypothetical protein
MSLRLHALFQDLESPPRETGGSLHVNTTRVPGMPAHRLGKDADGSPVLLLQVAAERGQRPADVQLENLSVLHEVSCRIWSTNARVATGQFTVVRCNSSIEDVRHYFIHVMEPFLATLGKNPTPSIVSQLINHLVEMFRALSQPPRGSVQGLWAELFVIAMARDPQGVVRSWHTIPEETFDFAAGSERVEVKSTSGTERRHIFSLEQLEFGDSTVGVIASVLTQRAGGGTSIGDLAGRVRQKVATYPDLLLRIDKTIALTLGDSSVHALEERFNEDFARDSLEFFDAREIPRPREIPDQVSGVRFEADLSTIRSLLIANLIKSKGLLKAIAPTPRADRQNLSSRR